MALQCIDLSPLDSAATRASPCDTPEAKSQHSLADVASFYINNCAFDGFSSPRRRRRRLCGGRMSGASLARRRVDEYYRRLHWTTTSRSSARSVAPALAPRHLAIEVRSSATLTVDGMAGHRQVPAGNGRDCRGGRRVAKERLLRRRVSRAELVVAAVVDGWLAGQPQRHLCACGHECQYLFCTAIDSSC